MNNLKNILIIKRKNIKKQKLETNILKIIITFQKY